MNTVFLCLGGNIGNRAVAINNARLAIERYCGQIITQSFLYQSESWGYQSSNRFLNQVIKIQTNLGATQLLKTIKSIERKAGRTASKNETYSDRVIDIDILFYNSEVIKLSKLEVPHARLHERRFVLVPLNQIASRHKHPALKKTVNTLLRNCEDKSRVTRYNETYQPYICIEGNIGAGKSTLALALAKKINADLIGEKFEDIKSLPLFYKSPQTHALAVEKEFMTSRFKQLRAQLKNKDRALVSDFSFYRSLWFAKVNLPQKQLNKFVKLFQTYRKKLRKPDLIVYLKAKPQRLLKNIQTRGRDYEKSIKQDYLVKITQVYNKEFKLLNGINKLEIEIHNYNPKRLKIWVNHIEKIITETFG